MNAAVLDENGAEQHMQMGCYGLGVTRTVAAAIEQNHDERGIIWPEAMAPFSLVIVALNIARDEEVRATAEQLYEELQSQGVDVLFDDRDASPGVKLADADLIGIPHRVVVELPRPEAGHPGIQAPPLARRRAPERLRGPASPLGARPPLTPSLQIRERQRCASISPFTLWALRSRRSSPPFFRETHESIHGACSGIPASNTPRRRGVMNGYSSASRKRRRLARNVEASPCIPFRGASAAGQPPPSPRDGFMRLPGRGMQGEAEGPAVPRI